MKRASISRAVKARLGVAAAVLLTLFATLSIAPPANASIPQTDSGCAAVARLYKSNGRVYGQVHGVTCKYSSFGPYYLTHAWVTVARVSPATSVSDAVSCYSQQTIVSCTGTGITRSLADGVGTQKYKVGGGVVYFDPLAGTRLFELPAYAEASF